VLSVVAVGATAIGCGSDNDTSTTGIKTGQKVVSSDKIAEVTARTAVTAMEVYAVDHGGSYTGADAATLRSIEPRLPPNLYVQAQSTSYSVTVPAKLSGTQFTVEKRTGGALSFTCSSPGTGTCPPSGDWGS